MASRLPEGKQIVTDVVVVGYGGAGAVTAITAHDAGAEVIILEKTADGGGNTRWSMGLFQSPLSMRAVNKEIELSSELTARELIEVFVANAIENKTWVQKLGGELEREVALDVCYPRLSDVWFAGHGDTGDIASFHVKYGEDEKGGEKFWQLLAANVARRGITIMTNTPARELITDDQGGVTGLIAEQQGQKFTVKARKAVVLTCGGFAYNDAMKQKYLPCQPLIPTGHPGNTGDGFKMVEKVKADLWHMSDFIGCVVFKPPEYEAGFQIMMYGSRFIYVNKTGKRFTNEAGHLLENGWEALCYFDKEKAIYPNIPAYAIFDDVNRRRAPLYPALSGRNRDYKWSLDNSKELSKGWIKKGKTIRELAKVIGLNAQTLEETVNRYNEYCESGKDPDFGRAKQDLEPIETPPYYAIELWPNITCTLGGPRRDQEARVLNTEGKPIPGLFAAGEFGSIWARIPDASSCIAECLVFGRIAGRNAAAMPSRVVEK